MSNFEMLNLEKQGHVFLMQNVPINSTVPFVYPYVA